MEGAKLDPDEHVTYSSNDETVVSKTPNAKKEGAKQNSDEHVSYSSNKETIANEIPTTKTEGAKLDPDEHVSHSSNNEIIVNETANSAATPDNPPGKKFSSKNALAMVMDFSILSNSTVMLIDVIQQWELQADGLLTTLLVLLPFIMFLQLPVAVMVILASHGNYSENTKRHFHNWILALLSLSTALMLISDLLKVKTDSMQIMLATSEKRSPE